MKKLIMMALIFVASVNASAVTVTAGNQVESYIQATMAALGDATCTDSIGARSTFYIKEYLNRVTSVEVSDGAQPLLVFSEPLDNGGVIKTFIETSQDYRTITKAYVKTFKRGTVNKGDLKSPIMVQDLILYRTCN